jgi:hypothetical protein
VDLRPIAEAEGSGDKRALAIGLMAGIRVRRRGAKGLFQHFQNYVDEDFMRRSDPEAHEQDESDAAVADHSPRSSSTIITVTRHCRDAVHRRQLKIRRVSSKGHPEVQKSILSRR